MGCGAGGVRGAGGPLPGEAGVEKVHHLYRAEKAGVVHTPIGKVSFSTEDLVENFNAVQDALAKAKPAAAKGQYVKSVSVSSTMGPGAKINPTKVLD